MNEKETKEIKDNEEKEEHPLVQTAQEAATRLEAANKKAEEILKANLELEARGRLGGKADITVPKKDEEVSAEDYAKQVLGGKL